MLRKVTQGFLIAKKTYYKKQKKYLTINSTVNPVKFYCKKTFSICCGVFRRIVKTTIIPEAKIINNIDPSPSEL